MAAPKDPWGNFITAEEAYQRERDRARQEMFQQLRQIEADRLAKLRIRQQALVERQQQQIHAGDILTWGNITWVGPGGAFHTPDPPTPGDFMITLLPEKEEIDVTEIAHIRNWISDQAQGKKRSWPNFPMILRVNGKGRYVQGGVWEIPAGSNNIFLGNERGHQTPLWAASALMAIARYYHLDTDKELVKLIHEMLAALVAKEINPVMTDLANGYNGSPVTEIAVNKKERVFVGKYAGPDGKETFRHLSGEEVEINATDWVILKM